MNQDLSKVGRLAFKPVFALTMVTLLALSVLMDAKPAAANTVPGEFCIQGLVIDHEEKPLAGWNVTVINEFGHTAMATSAPEPDKEDLKNPDVLRKGQFKIDEVFEGMNGLGIPLPPGLYTATLELQDGWMEVTPAEFQFPIRSNMHNCVKIRFKVKQISVVEVYKIDRNHEPLKDWHILAKPAEGNVFAEAQEGKTDEDGRVVFTLTVGSWIFMERPPNQDPWRPIVPPSGKLELKVESGRTIEDPYILVFKNELLTGCIEVIKYGVVERFPEGVPEENGLPGFATPIPTGSDEITPTLSGYLLAGWGFKLLRTDHSLVDIKYTDGTGKAKFTGLPFGPYILIEEDRAGWTELNERYREVNVTSAGDCVQIQFENEQDDSGFAIEGRKLDANGHYGLAGWTIKVKPLDKGGYTGVTEVTTNGLGEYRIEFPDNDYRIPGARFELCEVVEKGWEPLTPTCQIVKLPEKASPFPVKAKDFINQQIGHSPTKPHVPGKGDHKGDYCSTYHVVKKGEGLFSIGAAYGVSPQAMLNANPSVRNNANYWVYVGQRLCIP